MELNEKDKKYVQGLKSLKKLFLFLSPVMLIFAVSWVMFINIQFNKLSAIERENNFNNKINSIKTTTNLEVKLKSVLLANSESFLESDNLLKTMLVLFGSLMFFMLAIYFYSQYLTFKRILSVIYKLQTI